MTFEKTTQ